MTDTHETVDARLERLARATEGIRARPDLSQRVMLAVQASAQPGWLESVALTARPAVAAALLAVAAAVVVAVQSDREATEASAVAYGTVELPW